MSRWRLRYVALGGLLAVAVTGGVYSTKQLLYPYLGIVPKPKSTPLQPPAGPIQFDRHDVQAQDYARIQGAIAGLPGYKDAVPQPLSDDLKFGEGSMAVAWFSTHDSADQVLSYYDNEFRRGGYPLVRARFSAGAGYSGYLDPKTQLVHLISVLTEGGQTLVFVSSAEAEKMLTHETEVPEILPHPQGTSGNVVLASTVEGHSRRNITATISSGSIESVVEFYRKGFVDKGWAVDGVFEGSNGDVTVNASRIGKKSTALIHRLEHGGMIQLFVTLEEDPA